MKDSEGKFHIVLARNPWNRIRSVGILKCKDDKSEVSIPVFEDYAPWYFVIPSILWNRFVSKDK